MPIHPTKLFSDVDLPLEGEDDNLERLDRILSGLYSLAGGIVMATVFIDVIPHVQSMLKRYEKQNKTKLRFPIAYFLICIGFLLTFGFTEISKKIWRYHAKRKQGMPQRRREANMMVAAIVFALAMSVHSFLEGFALLQNTTNRIVELLLALLLHKVVEAISTGNSSQSKREKIVAIVTAVLVFGLMIPLGSAVGSVIDIYQLSENQQERLTLIFEALAGGIFIYVAMMEIIRKQRKNAGKREIHMWIIFIGFCLVVGIHLTFGSVILRAAGGDEEEFYPDIFEERSVDMING